MHPAAKAQFDLAMAWSELAFSTFAASTMLANSSAKVFAASAALERATQPAACRTPALAPWPSLFDDQSLANPMYFAYAAAEASRQFWMGMLEPPKPAVKPLPLWWTAFADPVLPAKPAEAVPPNYLLH